MKKLILFLFLLCPVHLWAALSTSLISYWALDEASGDRADKVVSSANTLTQLNSPGSAAGKVYATALSLNGSTQEVRINDNASLSGSDRDFSFAVWFNSSSIATSQTILSKWFSPNREYLLRVNSSKAEFLVSSNGSSAVTVTDVTTLSSNTWYFVVASHDSINNVIKISVNGGTVTSTATSAGVFNGTQYFTIGQYDNGTAYFVGTVGPVIFWNKVLSAGEITQVYNNGAGLTYEGILGTGIIMHPLTSGFTSTSTSGTTASVTITTNDLILLTILGSGTTNSALSTLSGLGLTWESVRADNFDTSGTPTKRIQVFRGMGLAATGSVTWTLTGSDGMVWSLVAFSGVQTGNNGADAVVQSSSTMSDTTTSVSVTLSAFTDATNNVAFGAFGINTTGGITPGSGFVEIHDTTYTSPSAGIQTEWRIGQDTSVDSSFASSNNGAIALEIKAATAGTLNPAILSLLDEE